MSTNKHAQIRYLALDKCFSNYGRKYYIADLVNACNGAIYDFTGKQEGVKKRQVYEDIKFMESSQGWSIDLQRLKDGKSVYHRYTDKNFSINKSPLSQVELTQINEVILTLSRFRGMPQFEWVEEISSRLQRLGKTGVVEVENILDFEQNQFLKGLELISPLFNAIYNKRVIEVRYGSFKGPKEIIYTFHPYYLKQYNLRWFVFGLSSPGNHITNLALDRILSIIEKKDTYAKNTTIDFSEYFDDVIGVTIPTNAKAEKIVLSVTGELLPYIQTKPLHGSQKMPKFSDNEAIIELNLIINYELISKLLSLGDGIQVLEPDHLVASIKKRIFNMLNKYN